MKTTRRSKLEFLLVGIFLALPLLQGCDASSTIALMQKLNPVVGQLLNGLSSGKSSSSKSSSSSPKAPSSSSSSSSDSKSSSNSNSSSGSNSNSSTNLTLTDGSRAKPTAGSNTSEGGSLR